MLPQVAAWLACHVTPTMAVRPKLVRQVKWWNAP
jgi:hypothetical protein